MLLSQTLSWPESSTSIASQVQKCSMSSSSTCLFVPVLGEGLLSNSGPNNKLSPWVSHDALLIITSPEGGDLFELSEFFQVLGWPD